MKSRWYFFFVYLVLWRQIIMSKTANALSLFVSGMQVQAHTVSLSGDHTIKSTQGMDCALSKIAVYYGDVNSKITGSWVSDANGLEFCYNMQNKGLENYNKTVKIVYWLAISITILKCHSGIWFHCLFVRLKERDRAPPLQPSLVSFLFLSPFWFGCVFPW